MTFGVGRRRMTDFSEIFRTVSENPRRCLALELLCMAAPSYLSSLQLIVCAWMLSDTQVDFLASEYRQAIDNSPLYSESANILSYALTTIVQDYQRQLEFAENFAASNPSMFSAMG